MSIGLCLYLLLVALVAVPNQVNGCEIEKIRQLSQQPGLMGGWRVADIDAAAVQALKQKAVQSDGVDEGFQVSEAYQQVVAGMNYCIRFGANGKCRGGLCQSFECVAYGHKPLRSEEIINVHVTCNKSESCDIYQVSENAKTPMQGGWHVVSDNDVHVGVLHESASQMAAAKKGSVTRAFSQIVSGKKFCIEFQAEGLRNCQRDKCQPTTCVAGGFLPLALGGDSSTSAPHAIKNIGVVCMQSSNAVRSASSMTSLTAILTAILLAAILF